MKKAIFRAQLFPVLLALLVSTVAAAVIFHMVLTEEKESELLAMAETFVHYYDAAADPDDQAAVLGEEDIRVTIIAADGTVLGDSEADRTEMDNHYDRPEIAAAREAGQAVTLRESATLGRTLVYAVAVTEDGTYLRLSQSVSAVTEDLLRMLPALVLGAALSLLVALVLAAGLTDGILLSVRSLSVSLGALKEGKTTPEPVTCPYPELQEMSSQITQLSGEIGAYLRQLEEQQQKTDYILDHLAEGFVLVNQEQEIQMMNRSARRQLGCGEEQIGQSLGRLLPNPRIIQNAKDAMLGQKAPPVDLRCRGRIYEVRFRPIQEETGDLKGKLILTLLDVTESRNSSRMRQEFFSNASHELKTPITAIQGNTELLCSGLPLTDEQRRELLDRIGAETQRMSLMISDIIMPSRLESGTLEREPEQVPFHKLVRECVHEWETPAAGRGVTIETRVEPVWLYASPQNLRELADNLISNAVKYNRPGGKVEISLTRRQAECILTVRNDGEPIPPEHQSRVFERFYRVDRGRSRSAGGTGLGLSIVKHVVDAMDGRISLESNRTLGTRFTIRLPIRRRENV